MSTFLHKILQNNYLDIEFHKDFKNVIEFLHNILNNL